MIFDYKKEYKELYAPPKTPGVVVVPSMNFLAVRGRGDPNEADGAYHRAIGLLYGTAYTLKMSYKGAYKINGFFEYVVPPLEGFWWQDGLKGVDYSRKADFRWVSLLRLPDFIAEQDVAWAVAEAGRKKKMDFSPVEFLPYDEGLCLQCMHIGPYDDEPATVAAMHAYAGENGYAVDISDTRFHHEIYIGDPRKTAPEKLKTILRHPVRQA